MNTTIKKSLEQESTDELFFYFKHNGTYNFEKKLIAGKLLKERGFDTQILQKEKQLTIEKLQANLKKGETPDLLLRKSKQQVFRNMLSWFGFIFVFLSLEIFDNITNPEKSWESTGIIFAISLTFISYSFITYKKNVNKLMYDGAKNNELLRLRLSYIDKEWVF